MKHTKLKTAALAAYCVLAGVVSVLVIAVLAHNYGALGEKVPVYRAPWGGSWGDKDKSLFYVFRLPAMALCLQCVLLGLYPQRMDGWPDAAYAGMRQLLAGLSVMALSQLTLNPYVTLIKVDALAGGIALCATLALGLALAVIGCIALNRALKPLCKPDQTPYALLLDFLFKGCRRRRALIIGAGIAFMVLLIIPSL